MIPGNSGLLNQDFVIEEQPTQTYKMDFDKLIIRGHIDNKSAIEQTIYKILFTERYEYAIYSWNYGIELMSLFGEPISYVIPEIRRRIEEALLIDSRIKSVNNFNFEVGKGTVLTTFTANTIFGNFIIKRSVNF